MVRRLSSACSSAVWLSSTPSKCMSRNRGGEPDLGGSGREPHLGGSAGGEPQLDGSSSGGGEPLLARGVKEK
jgi:hypothetical protein